MLNAVESSLAEVFENMLLGSQVVPFPESQETDIEKLGPIVPRSAWSVLLLRHQSRSPARTRRHSRTGSRLASGRSAGHRPLSSRWQRKRFVTLVVMRSRGAFGVLARPTVLQCDNRQRPMVRARLSLYRTIADTAADRRARR